jgi:hypothetical protein
MIKAFFPGTAAAGGGTGDWNWGAQRRGFLLRIEEKDRTPPVLCVPRSRARHRRGRWIGAVPGNHFPGGQKDRSERQMGCERCPYGSIAGVQGTEADQGRKEKGGGACRDHAGQVSENSQTGGARVWPENGIIRLLATKFP